MGGRGEGKRPCPSLPHCLYVCMCIKDSRSGSRDSATAVTGDSPPLVPCGGCLWVICLVWHSPVNPKFIEDTLDCGTT